MDAAAKDTHYTVLGLARGAAAAEIRRAFRQLALRHHPDRAGPGTTELFQRIALAYQVLSDPIARSTYDARLSETEPRSDERRAPHAASSPRRPGSHASVRDLDDLIERLAAPLETLIARAAARRLSEGLIELQLTRDEVQRGGTVAIGLPLLLPCPTCGGCAQPGSIWCVRCEFEGSVREEVTVCLAIPPFVPDGATFTVHIDPRDAVPPLRVRVRRA